MSTGPPSSSPRDPESAPRIGLLGGTFDPPHRGHLAMARRAIEALGLLAVVFVPVRSPSHKSAAEAGYDDRVRMVEAMIGGEPAMRVSRVESQLGEKSYTVPMLRAVRQELPPHAELYFLIGADSLTQLHLWHRYREILELATVVAFSRPGFPLTNPHLTPLELGKVRIVEGLEEPAASRDRRDGRAVDLPPGVEDYIASRGLYRKG